LQLQFHSGNSHGSKRQSEMNQFVFFLCHLWLLLQAGKSNALSKKCALCADKTCNPLISLHMYVCMYVCM
jgi:hypothetical protein